MKMARAKSLVMPTCCLAALVLTGAAAAVALHDPAWPIDTFPFAVLIASMGAMSGDPPAAAPPRWSKRWGLAVLLILLYGVALPHLVAVAVLACRAVLGLPVHRPWEFLGSLLDGPLLALPGIWLGCLVALLVGSARPGPSRAAGLRGAMLGAVTAFTILLGWFYGVHWNCILGSTGEEMLHCWLSFSLAHLSYLPIAILVVTLAGAAVGGLLGSRLSRHAR